MTTTRSGSMDRPWIDHDEDVGFDQREDGVPGGPRQAVCLVHIQAPGPQRLQGLQTCVPGAQLGDQAGGERAVIQPEPLPHPAHQSTELPEGLLSICVALRVQPGCAVIQKAVRIVVETNSELLGGV